MGQRRAHGIEGEHEASSTSNVSRRLVQEMGTLQTERLKARAKLSNRILPVSFAKREMTSALVFIMDVRGEAMIFSEERVTGSILCKRSMLHVLSLIMPLHKCNPKCLFLSYWCRVPSSS